MGWLEGKLRNASNNGELEKVKSLLAEGADINAANKQGSTALHLAVRQGHLLILKYLLKQGADISLQDIHGHTPLYIAIFSGTSDVLKELLSDRTEFSQADLNESFRVAVQLSHVEMTVLLLKYGADVNVQDHRGYTALDTVRMSHRTATVAEYQSRYERIIEILENRGALLHWQMGWRQ